MDDLREWLDTRPHNYEKGVRLFQQYNRDPLFIALFKEDESEFKRNKLRTLIEAIVADAPAKKVFPSPTPKKSEAFDHTGWPPPADTVLKALWDQGRPLYYELMNLTARMYDVAVEAEKGILYKQEEAARMALRICELDDLLDDIYYQRDFYNKNGHLPAPTVIKPVVVDPVAWAKELQNAQRYIRDYRLKLNSQPSNKNAHKWAQKLQYYMAEEVRLKKLLNLDDE